MFLEEGGPGMVFILLSFVPKEEIRRYIASTLISLVLKEGIGKGKRLYSILSRVLDMEIGRGKAFTPRCLLYKEEGGKGE